MQRFFLHSPLVATLRVEDPAIVHQIGRVLRAAPGDEVVFFDGSAPEERLYRIVRISKGAVECEYAETRPSRCEPRRRVVVAQAMPNTLEKLEYALQKCVELGASGFWVFRSERSQKPLPAEAKRERLAKIAQEATEQCGGCRLPAVEYFESLADLPLDPAACLALDMAEPGRPTLAEDAAVTLLVGPEWGWSDAERERFARAGIARVGFGERVLRTETAAVAACAIFAAGRDFW